MAEVAGVDIHMIVTKGQAVYARIGGDLEPTHRGEAVAIEVDSGEYFLGKTGLEATEKAREKFPDKLFYVARIGRGPYVSFGGWRGRP